MNNLSVLLLSDPGTRAALNHPALAGLTRIGRGKFSVVFDKGDTVIRLTADPIAYALHCDGVMAPRNNHLSVVHNDFGDVGEQRHNGAALWMFETEKLVPLKGFIPARRQMQLIQRAITQPCGRRFREAGEESYSRLQTARKWLDDNHADQSEELLDMVSDLAVFATGFQHAALDMHNGNFMVRSATGELIFNDPFSDMSLLSDRFDTVRRYA